MTPAEINKAVYKKLGWHADSYAFIPHYSEDIRAAWDIVDHLKAQGHYIKLKDGFWRGDPEWHFSSWGMQAEADTAPMAICKAFLGLP